MENQGFAGGRVAGRRIARKPCGRIPRIATIVKINIYLLYIIERAGVGGQSRRSESNSEKFALGFHKRVKTAPEKRGDAARCLTVLPPT